MSKGIYTWTNAESVGRYLRKPSQTGVPDEHYRTQLGNVICLRDVDAMKAESERLDSWRERWLKLANNRDRMRKMGGLQSQQDYIVGRSMRASSARKLLLEAYWKVLDKKPAKLMTAPASHEAEVEVAAWRSRFPEYKYRPQDDCVALV